MFHDSKNSKRWCDESLLLINDFISTKVYISQIKEHKQKAFASMIELN